LSALPGAAVLALTLHPPVPSWAGVVCFVAIGVAVPGAIAVDAATPRVLPVLLAGTAIGMWATTPDTEHTRVLVGPLLRVVLLFLDGRLRSGAGGSAAIVGMMTWAAVVDGYPRHGAIVGALACFGAVVLLPLVGRARVGMTWFPLALTIGVQAAIVVV